MPNSDWRSDIQEAKRRENWSLKGPNRVVKVTPLVDRKQSVGGYITLARFLLGKSPTEIEKLLGLPLGFLANGARIYNLSRLPNPSEYEFELTAQFPAGLAYNPAHGDPAYGPGSDKTLQWKIKPGTTIPIDPRSIIELSPNQRFPYA
jgi:hypothetical protein